MKALITGYPGTGKSSVAKELRNRGHRAYDTESMRGYMHAQDVRSGKKIPLPDPIPRGWFENAGGYNWDLVRLLELLNAHEDIYICALADNQEELYDIFEKIFLLVLDESEMEHRLRLRESTNYGKDPGEVADILLNHRHFERSLLERGAIPINTDQAVQQVVDKILSNVINPDN